MATTVVLASPVEPSGASWLVNCLLELGVKVSHKPIVDSLWRQGGHSVPAGQMWQRDADGRYRLHPRAQLLRKWLPALSRTEAFVFREDVEIEYVQDLPSSRDQDRPVALFVRDPRDSIYSAYRRMQPDLRYESFLRFLNPDTLCDRATHWRVFVEGWLALAGGRRFTFEGYKQAPAPLLQRVLLSMDIQCDAAAVERAVAASDFEQARAAELRYRAEHPADRELANRAKRVGESGEQADARPGRSFIEARIGSLLGRLGYQSPGAGDPAGLPVPAVLRCLPFDPSSGAPERSGPRPTEQAGCDSSLEDACRFAVDMDEAMLRASNLPSHRIRHLLERLGHVARAQGWSGIDRIDRLQERFGDGSEHQFAQLRALLERRRRATPDA